MTHYQNFEDVEIVAIADVVEPSLKAKQAQFSVPHIYTDYKKMLAEQQLDAVSICTPNFLHAPNTIDALNAGCHVLVEKPMSMTTKESEDMVAAAKKNKKKLVIGFQYRFDPRVSFLRSSSTQGKGWGNIMFTRVQALRRRGIPNWGVFGRKDLQGGGPMIDIGVHMIECAHFTMGSPKPVAAMGRTWTYLGNQKKASTEMAVPMPNWDYKTYTVEDLAVGHVRFDNGAVMAIESAFAAHIKENSFTFQVMGETGGGTFDPPEIFRDDHGHMLNVTPGFVADSSFGKNFERKMRNFVDHVLYDQPTMAPGEHGVMVQKILNGIYESAEKGKEVAIS